jgi:hypothetical protein
LLGTRTPAKERWMKHASVWSDRPLQHHLASKLTLAILS